MLQPVMMRPSVVSSAAPTLKSENAAMRAVARESRRLARCPAAGSSRRGAAERADRHPRGDRPSIGDVVHAPVARLPPIADARRSCHGPGRRRGRSPPPTPRRRAASTAACLASSRRRAVDVAIALRPGGRFGVLARCGCRSSAADGCRRAAAGWCRSPCGAPAPCSWPVSVRNSLSLPSAISSATTETTD